MSAWLTVDVIAIALLAWASLFKIIPSCNLSRFRYKLWRIRDAVVDEIYAGEFEEDEQPRKFVDLVETTIVHSREVTLARLLLFHFAIRGVPEPSFEDEFQVEAMTGHDRELIEGHLSALMSAMARQLFLGGPSGWLMLVVASPFALIAALRSGRRGEPQEATPVSSVLRAARAQFREGIAIEVEPTLAVMSQRNGNSRRSLSQCV